MSGLAAPRLTAAATVFEMARRRGGSRAHGTGRRRGLGSVSRAGVRRDRPVVCTCSLVEEAALAVLVLPGCGRVDNADPRLGNRPGSREIDSVGGQRTIGPSALRRYRRRERRRFVHTRALDVDAAAAGTRDGSTGIASPTSSRRAAPPVDSVRAAAARSAQSMGSSPLSEPRAWTGECAVVRRSIVPTTGSQPKRRWKRVDAATQLSHRRVIG